jgi:hypothetical protein
MMTLADFWLLYDALIDWQKLQFLRHGYRYRPSYNMTTDIDLAEIQ